MKTEYSNITFRIRTRIMGLTIAALSAKEATITRVTADGRDDVTIVTKRGTCVVPWSHVASAVEIPAKAKAAPPAKAKAA